MNRIPLLIALTTLAACGGDKADTDPKDSSTSTSTTATTTGTTGTTTNVTVPIPTGDAATVDLAGECDLDIRWGSFLVSIYDLYSIVDGSIANGVVPITVLEEMGSTPECTLLRRNNPFCDPACQPDETCDFDGTCLPFPLNQDLGVATVGGLAADVIMFPVQPGNNYFDTQVPHPAFAPGDLIELNTAGGAFDPVRLHGVGVEPIVLLDDAWVLLDGQDMPFTWEPPVGADPRSKVHVRLNIDQHGNTPIQLFCEFDDTGAAALPSSLVTLLIGAGVTGFPNATVTRRTVDSTPVGDGCVDFTVATATDPSVTVDGFIYCTDDTPCIPFGQTCNLAIEICE